MAKVRKEQSKPVKEDRPTSSRKTRSSMGSTTSAVSTVSMASTAKTSASSRGKRPASNTRSRESSAKRSKQGGVVTDDDIEMNNESFASSGTSSTTVNRKPSKLSKATKETSSVTKNHVKKSNKTKKPTKSKKSSEVNEITEMERSWGHDSTFVSELIKFKANETCALVKSSDARKAKPPALQFATQDNVQYVIYPALKNDEKRYGLIQIKPGAEKTARRTAFAIRFTVLKGSVGLKCRNETVQLQPGNIFTVPGEIKYGMKNDTDQKCFIQFETFP